MNLVVGQIKVHWKNYEKINIPIINGDGDVEHPTQVLDVFTTERKRDSK